MVSATIKYMAKNFSSFPKNALRDNPKLLLKITAKKLTAINIPKAFFRPFSGNNPQNEPALHLNALFNNQRKIAGQIKLSIAAFENGRQKITKHRQANIARSQYKMILFLSIIVC